MLCARCNVRPLLLCSLHSPGAPLAQRRAAFSLRNRSCGALRIRSKRTDDKQKGDMKNYLIVACAVMALVGCARDDSRGGTNSRSGSQTGQSETIQSTNSASLTNDSSGASSSSSGTQSQSSQSNTNNNSSGSNGSGNNSSGSNGTLPKNN